MNTTTEKKPTIEIKEIMDLIPHRYPMLLVDRILEYVPHESAVGLKNVTFNEPCFNGHFPGNPVMPGVLIVEAMAQTAGILVVHSLGQSGTGKMVYFMTIESAKFRKPVVPGDSMHIHVQCIKSRGNVYKFRGEAKVDGVLCAEAEYSAMIFDKDDKK
jgi:3-hydroxyacyl-[acyl-carrier-protein] dehydratase